MSSWKSHKCATLCGAALGLIDVSMTTVTFGHGNQFKEQFLVDVYLYDFSTSMFELWVFGLFRMTIITGGILGFICQPKVAVTRFSGSKPIVTALLTLMWVYTLTKLLVYSEAVPELNKPWFWALFAWTQLSILLTYITWTTFASLEISDQESCDVNVNTSDEERQPLLGKRQHHVKGDDSSSEDGINGERKEKSKSSMKTAWRLLKYSKPDWYIVLTAFIFLSASSVSEVFLPFYTGSVIDGIAIKRSKSLFVRAIIIMAVLSVGSSFAAGIRGGCFKVAIARLQMRVCNHLFSALMKHEVAFYDKTRTGEITSRLTSDTTTMSEGLSLNVNIFLRSLLQAVGTAVFMFRLSWQLSMVTVMGMPIIMVVSELYGEYYKNLSKKVQDTLAKANEVAEEACSSMRTVRSFANETAEADRYASRLIDTYKLKVKESLAYAGYMWCSDLFGLSLVVATLYYGGHLVISDRLSGGHLVSFILYQMQLGYCIESIAGVYTGVMQAVGASEKVFEFMDRKPQIKHEGKLKPAKFSGALQFRNVTFTYPSRPDVPVLKNVSFRVKPGEVVALVGPSGGGKSTCVNLIEHFYETSSGQVLLDDIPIEQYDHKYLHSKVALVGQEPVLYARSIRENIAYGMEDVDLNLVQSAAKQANAHDFISDLKDQYETQAGEKGAQLSGGQKQRVAIARALIRNPAILLLDEATSALDSESEHIVQQAVYNNLTGHTVLIVAHRLSTVEKANRIIVISKGEVAEEGTHKDLLECGGLYAQLVRRQLLSFNASPGQQALSASHSPSIHSTSNSFKSINSNSSDPTAPAVLKASLLSRSPVFGSV